MNEKTNKRKGSVITCTITDADDDVFERENDAKENNDKQSAKRIDGIKSLMLSPVLYFRGCEVTRSRSSRGHFTRLF